MDEQQGFRAVGRLAAFEPGTALDFLRDLAPSAALLRLEGITDTLLGPLGRQMAALGAIPVPDTFSGRRLPTEAERARAEAMRAHYARPPVDWQALADRLSRPESGGGFGIEELTPSED
jgi:hypothetical protein